MAWLAELFTDPKQRERVLGYTQAFSSVGGAMVTARQLRCDLTYGDVAARDLRRSTTRGATR